jgi:hypothetical protein
MIDFEDDPMFDEDEDFDDISDTDDNVSRFRKAYNNFEKNAYKLERMRLRNANKANRRMNAVKKIAAKRGTKLTAIFSLTLFMFK